MTGALTSGLTQYSAPSYQPSTDQLSKSRGLCTLSFGGNQLVFRTNPNEISWDYELITHVDQTYGGRVIQILGVKLDNLTVKVDCGQGGWPYAMQVVQFMRDLMVTQRNGQPASFVYTTRGWNLKVFALGVPFADSVTETVRELELNFKIQEDIAKLNIAASISDFLSVLQDGIGWSPSGFNNINADNTAPDPRTSSGVSSVTPATVAPSPATAASSAAAQAPNLLGATGLGSLFGG